jgi:hypothetical protein
MSQELSTAKYYEQSLTEQPIVRQEPARRALEPAEAKRPTGGLDRLSRWATAIVAIVVFAGGAAALWLNRVELEQDAKFARERSNPLNFMLWLGGSDKTMKDVVQQAQQNATNNWQGGLGAGSDFEGVDLSKFSQELNAGVGSNRQPASNKAAKQR